jgi:RNA polymerase sigma factor for flagellar operon FliA
MNETLTREDELWRQFIETGSQETKGELIMCYAPLVKSCANKLRWRVPSSIEYTDLVSYGFIGLMDALERYDPSYNRNFAIYARSRIAGAIIDGIRVEAGIPRSAYEKWKRVSQAEENLTVQLQRYPEQEEIADFLGLDSREYDHLLWEIQSSRLMSLDELASNDDGDGGYTLLDAIVDKSAPDPVTSLEEDQLGVAMERALKGLPERYRLILKLHYYEDLSLREIAEVLSISKSLASQMHCHALSRLRNSMNGRLALLSA